MTLFALIISAALSSTAPTDSDRMAHVIATAYRDQPTLALVEAPQPSAPLCVEFCTQEKEPIQ